MSFHLASKGGFQCYYNSQLVSMEFLSLIFYCVGKICEHLTQCKLVDYLNFFCSIFYYKKRTHL